MDSSPLTQDHYALIASSLRRSRKLAKAARVARFNAMTLIVFAALSIAFGLTDPVSLGLGIVLGIVGIRELRGATRLEMLKLDAPRSLAISEGLLAAGLIAYAAIQIYKAMHPSAALAAQTQQLDSIIGEGSSVSISHLARTISIFAYIGLAVGTIIAQGLLAMYYLRRGRLLRDYLSQTPPWIIELQRTIRAA